MASAQVPSLLNLALDDGQLSSSHPPFGRLLAVSLALHCGVLMVAHALHLAHTREEPLVAQEVSLVTLSLPDRSSRRTAEASKPKAEPKPLRQKPQVAPTPPPVTPSSPPSSAAAKAQTPEPPVDDARARSDALMQEALNKIKLPPSKTQSNDAPPVEAKPVVLPELQKPVQAPGSPARGDSAKAKAQSEARVREALEKIELPPQTPEFRGLAPAPTVAPTPSLPARRKTSPVPVSPEARMDRAPTPQLERDVQSLVDRLAVPEAPTQPPPVERARKPMAPAVKSRASLSQDIKRRLEEIERIQLAKASPAEVPTPDVNVGAQDAPETAPPSKARAAAPNAAEPKTLIRAPQATAGSSDYLARVQLMISKRWISPPVDLSDHSLVVVIRFRLHRSGSVSDVAVEQPSGNQYYDLAAERAVLSAHPLPSFPRSMRDPYLDTHFTFAVGEQAG